MFPLFFVLRMLLDNPLCHDAILHAERAYDLDVQVWRAQKTQYIILCRLRDRFEEIFGDCQEFSASLQSYGMLLARKDADLILLGSLNPEERAVVTKILHTGNGFPLLCESHLDALHACMNLFPGPVAAAANKAWRAMRRGFELQEIDRRSEQLHGISMLSDSTQ